ncbi:hypothetical protein ACHAWF_008015 [Thalassiosira exigua]
MRSLKYHLTRLSIAVAPWVYHASFAASFMMQTPQSVELASLSQSSTTTTLPSSPLFSPESEDEGSDEFDGFNPFQPGSKVPVKGGFGVLSDEERKKPPPSTPGGQISPRQMRMKDLTTDLLACLSDDDAVSCLLRANEQFLLEQLDNPDAVLEADSVYSPEMGREDRFRRYQEVMEERIENARAPAAKKALTALKNFVLERE